MKEFYAKANSLLKIRRNQPVVTKLQKQDELGETVVFDDKLIVEREIATYFTKVYERPSHMALPSNEIDFNVEDMEMQIDTGSGGGTLNFTREEIIEAAKTSNFNKGLGPDCFDGNLLSKSEQLKDKVVTEIANALNSATIPDYLREGRLVPL